MKILSFTCWHDVHDTAAALVCDGRLVAAAEEERFSRVKHDSSVPLRAIEFCLARGGLTMADVDVIAFPERPFRTGRDSKLADIDRAALWRLHRAGHVRKRGMLHHALLTTYLRLGLPSSRSFGMDPTVAGAFETVRQAHGELPPVRFYDHHLAHAAASFFTSGLDQAAIATIDGRGDPYATVTWRAHGTGMERLRSEPWCNSLGFYYRDCTRYLGLGDFGEGKTMGLGAYADPEELRHRTEQMLDTGDSGRWYRYRRGPSEELLGFPRRSSSPAIEAPYPQFAASVQRALEVASRRIARSAVAEAGALRALCLGGGVALNCAANGQLSTSGEFGPVWAFAASGDAGLSIGAALLAAGEAGELEPERVDHAYLGPEFDAKAIESALSSEPRITFERSARVADEAAARLAGGEVIGWFQGRMELGPRALGNRSILASPHTIEIRDRVNRLKGRELWRPLAPSVLADRAVEYFELVGESPFMLFATDVRPQVRDVVPGVVHVDGSARPQTVRRDQNPAFHDLIEQFGRRTGIPLVLNTSFNAAGEPIVCTPEDALRTFLSTGIDALVCGDFVVRRRGNA
jgi:carbamoyltransferase